MSGSNRSTFTNSVQQASLGTPVSTVETPSIRAELFTGGIKITQGDIQTTIYTSGGLVKAADGQTTILHATNSKGEMDAFQRQAQGAYAFGQAFGSPQFAVYTTSNKSFIRVDDDKAVLLSKLGEDTTGIALYQNGILSAGVITPAAAPSTTPRLDRDSPLTYSIV